MQESINYYSRNTSDVLINEKNWRNIVFSKFNNNNGGACTFNKELLYNICSISNNFSNVNTIGKLPYHYGDGKKYYDMTLAFNGRNNCVANAQAFGFEIAYQLRQMSDTEYKKLVDVWLEKVKTTCYEDVKTRVEGEYVNGLDLDFSEFVAQRPY